ncbi:major facilitator superfamily domain-containing protein [Dichotomopilus funicola]|uniref:Major facilitator superfamily domain-containing protein n=1 Tax=Dichotomopilus funicola TaxID=1934379 RepID=A0AAN6V3P5_9PEZI|nr:major facilitator superfamily domain-containing protein [Dichotomopilus funicola]
MEKGLVQEPEWKPGKQEYAVMLTLAVISLMVALDATILVSVLPTLAVDLQGTATDAFWAGTSYLLTCAVCQPFIAALSDIFGRKEMLLVSIVLFTLGTIICAPVAKTFAVLFVGRSIQGIGGGGIITMGQVIFADIVPLRQRPKYFSLVMAAWALGSVLGPFVGGLFVEHATWGWCFYINLPFCAIGLVLVPIYVKLSTAKSSLVSKLGRVDWIGGFFFIGGLTSFLIGISWAGVQYAWNSAATIAPMVVGVVSIVIAIFWEIYGAQEPFLRPSLFHSASAIATYSCALFQGFILFCALYYLPFYFTAIKFASPTITGLNIFPITFFLLPGSIVISLITTRIGRYRWAIWMGWAITAVSGGLLVLLDESTPTRIWAVIFAVFGIGNGMVLTSVNIGVQAVSRVEDAARAAAMYAFMRTLGMSLGVAVGGTVFQNVMSSKLHELGLPEEISHNSEAFVQVMAALSPTDPVRTGAILAYIAGFHGVYWALTSAAIASFFISLIIKRHSMDKSLESNYTLRGSQNPSRPVIKAGPSPTASQDWNNPPGAVSYNGYAHPEVEQETVYPEAFPATHTYTVPSTMPMAPQEQNLVGGTHPTISRMEEPITAYYIQPGGRIVPVNILPENQQGGEISGMSLGNHGYDARYSNSV